MVSYYVSNGNTNVPYRGVLTTHAHRSGVLLSISIDLSLENDVVVVVVDEEAVSFRNPQWSRLAIVGLVQLEVSAQEARATIVNIDNIPSQLPFSLSIW